MQIDKQQIINLLTQQGNQQQADQANNELPDQVDTDQHAGLLEKFGISSEMLSSLGGLGGLGDIGKKFGL